MYTAWGLSYISWIAHLRNTAGHIGKGDRYFLAMGDKMVYTEKEKAALVVFAFIIICSVIEIVLAAAMIKICETITKTPQVSSNWAAFYQVLFYYFLNFCLASFHLNFQESLFYFPIQPMIPLPSASGYLNVTSFVKIGALFNP